MGAAVDSLETAEFERLADAYTARVQVLKRALELLHGTPVPPPPSLTAAEHDAAFMLKARGDYRGAAEKATEQYEASKKKLRYESLPLYGESSGDSRLNSGAERGEV